MRDFLLRSLLLSLFLTLTATAQTDSLSYLLRTDGLALEAATLEKLVELKMSPQWDRILRTPGNVRERRALGKVLNAFAGSGDTGRLGDVRRLHTGMMLATLEDWRGHLKLRLDLRFAPDRQSRKETLAGLERLADSLEKLARDKQDFKMTAVFDPRVTDVRRSALIDRGSTVFVTLPARHGWSQARIDVVIRSHKG